MAKSHKAASESKPIAERSFAAVILDVFDGYFALHGAKRTDFTDSVFRYESAEWFAEAVYFPSDAPRYSPKIVVGVIPELFIDPRRNRIDVMHTVPMGCELRRKNLTWQYTNEDEARHAFVRVRDEIVDVYTRPLFSDSARLQALMVDRCAELNASWHKETRRHNEGIKRRAALQAFRVRDYASVVRLLGDVRAESLSPSDLKKLEIAKRSL